MAGAISTIFLLSSPAFLAFAGTTLLLRRKPLFVLGGAAFVLVAGLWPLLLGYGFVLRIVSEVVGAAAAAAIWWRRLATPGWVLAAVALVVLVGEPVLALNVWQVQNAESYDRCAGNMAVASIQKSVAQGRGYPADMYDVAAGDGEYGVGPCYVGNGTNWLYRVAAPNYTIGYWDDWHVTRHVCLYTSRSNGWTCGFEMWGPFKPGEVD